jgi:hypothetical protein
MTRVKHITKLERRIASRGLDSRAYLAVSVRSILICMFEDSICICVEL